MGKKVQDLPRAYCPRCKKEVPVDVPWPGFRVAWRAWIVVAAILAICSPVIATDLLIMLPTASIFLLGGSTLKRYSEKRSACHLCALPLDEEAKPVSTRAATEGTS